MKTLLALLTSVMLFGAVQAADVPDTNMAKPNIVYANPILKTSDNHDDFDSLRKG